MVGCGWCNVLLGCLEICTRDFVHLMSVGHYWLLILGARDAQCPTINMWHNKGLAIQNTNSSPINKQYYTLYAQK